MSNLRVHVLRLKPGEDVVEKLQHYMTQCAPRGVFVMTCCGSVTSATLRLAANTENVTNKVVKYRGHYEVLSLSGTISRGGLHLHICLGDHSGGTRDGGPDCVHYHGGRTWGGPRHHHGPFTRP